MISKNRWGDVATIKSSPYTYIIHIDKEDNIFEDGERYIPWFDIHISNKTAKRRYLEKDVARYEKTGKIFNIYLMKQIEYTIRDYLDLWEPEYIVISAYQNDYYRRIRLYLSRLDKMGYKVCKICRDSTIYPEVYYLKKVVNCDSIYK